MANSQELVPVSIIVPAGRRVTGSAPGVTRQGLGFVDGIRSPVLDGFLPAGTRLPYTLPAETLREAVRRLRPGAGSAAAGT
jgi:hypothetical protein